MVARAEVARAAVARAAARAARAAAARAAVGLVAACLHPAGLRLPNGLYPACPDCDAWGRPCEAQPVWHVRVRAAPACPDAGLVKILGPPRYNRCLTFCARDACISYELMRALSAATACPLACPASADRALRPCARTADAQWEKVPGSSARARATRSRRVLSAGATTVADPTLPLLNYRS